MRIAVIGGGAAGFAAALAAAQRGAEVTVLERNKKPLKKLGVAGNGRGNILNAGEPAYFGDAAFAREALRRVSYEQLREFFTSLGVPLREEQEGWVYPAALQAAVVQDALLLRARQLGVTVLCLSRVESLARDAKGFLISGLRAAPGEENPQSGTPFTLRADKVIVACGGAAAPAHGTDGTAYGLLTALGHTRTPLFPALCALLVPKTRIQGLEGQRVRARLRLMDGDTPVRESRGEALFAQDAVSGIAAMQLGRFAREGMELVLDLRDELNLQGGALAFLRSLAEKRAQLPMAELLTGALTAPVARFLLREAGVRDPQTPVDRAGAGLLNALAETMENLRLPVLGTRGFAFAQVTAGGIETKDFHPATMESRLTPGLYAAGEILDVDGDCGGFNLMFAFASGLLAGMAAAAC